MLKINYQASNNRFQAVARYLAAHEIWPVGMLVAASFITNRLLPLTIIVAVIYWIIRWIAYGKFSQRSAADWPVLLLALMVPVTIWVSAYPDLTTTQVLRLLSGFALYYAIVNWSNTTKRLTWLVKGIVICGFILAASAPFSVTWEMGKLPFIPDALYRNFFLYLPDTINPNVMAGSLVIILPLVLGIIFFAWRNLSRIERISAVVCSGAMIAILVLTKSRGAWMALAAVFLFLLVLRFWWGWISVIISAIGVEIAIYQFGLNNLFEMILSNPSLGGITGREEIWSRAILILRDFPFTGIGMGSFAKVAESIYPFTALGSEEIPHAHNLLLQVGIDLGIPGLVAWLTIFFLITMTSLQLYRYGKKIKDFRLIGFSAGLLSSQAALMVHGITDSVTWGMVRTAPLVWVLWGLSAAAINLYSDQGNEA